MGVVQNLCRDKTTALQPSLLRRRRVSHMRGSIEESNRGVYADIRRGFPRGDNAADDVLLRPELLKWT